jgi:phosphoribosylaminoimidazolecarboxamide formyltransferase/IMP cyclohydrolase
MKVIGMLTNRMMKDLLIAWGIGSTSNSNTITIVNDEMLIGNGVGQQDRVGAAELAIKRAIDAGHKDKLQGAVAYSDSFFPFPDGVQVLIDHGIGAIFSTTGSVNDKKIQDLCRECGVVLCQLPDTSARGFFGH